MQAKQNPQPSEVEGVSNCTSTAQLIRFLKGTYFAASNKERILEELKREIESDLEKVVQKARGCGLDDSQIREMLELIMED